MPFSDLWASLTPAHVMVLCFAIAGALLSTKDQALRPTQRVLNTLCGLCIASLAGCLALEWEYKITVSSAAAFVGGLVGNRLTAEVQHQPLGFARRLLLLIFWAKTGGQTPPPPDDEPSQ